MSHCSMDGLNTRSETPEHSSIDREQSSIDTHTSGIKAGWVDNSAPVAGKRRETASERDRQVRAEEKGGREGLP